MTTKYTAEQGRFVADLASEGIAFQGDSLARDFAFNAQCFLIQNMFTISKSTEKASPGIPGNVTHTQGRATHQWYIDQGKILHKKHVETHRGSQGFHRKGQGGHNPGMNPGQKMLSWPSGYKFISPVLSDGTYSPAQQFTSLSQQKQENVRALLNMTPSQQAQLVPLVRLYKVEYETDQETGRPDLNTGQDIEIVFDDFTREESLLKMSEGSAHEMYQNRGGRLGGAGIKSFSWDWKGVNPAEIDANITADLDIHFNSIDDLFQDQHRSRLDPLSFDPAQIGRASFLDLIIHAPTVTRDPGAPVPTPEEQRQELQAELAARPWHLLYNGKFFELKAVVGWQVPPNIRVEDEQFDEHPLQEILRETQLPLYLQLVSHNFKFEQDGSVDLSIRFRARLTARDDRYDLLRVSEEFLTTKIQRLKKKKGSLSDAQQEQAQHLQDDIDALERDLKDQLGERYTWILDQLAGGITALDKGYLYEAMARPVQLRALNTFSIEGADTAVISSYAQPASVDGLAALLAGEDTGEVLAFDHLGIARGTTADRGNQYAQTMQPGAQYGDPAIEFENIGAGRHSRALQGQVHEMGAIERDLVNDTPGSTSAEAAVSVGSVYQNQAFYDYGLSTNKKTGRPNFEEWKFFEAPSVYHKSGDPTFRRFVQGINTTRVNLGLYQSDEDREREGIQEEELINNTTFGARARELDTNNKYDERFPVTFFLLGDLLDIVIGRFRSTQRPENRGVWWDMVNGGLGFITSDIEFYDMKTLYATAYNAGAGADPRAFFTNLNERTVSFNPQARKQLIKPINLASIPIQYDLFLDWYIQKVVKPKRQRYYFYDFISDLLREVVAPALSSRCFPGLPPAAFQLTLGDIITDADSHLSKALGWGPSTKQHGEAGARRAHNVNTNATTMSELVMGTAIPVKLDGKKLKHPGLESSPGTPWVGEVHRNFKVLMATTMKPQMDGIFMNDTGTGDFNYGIYHFVLGADRGLLKRAVFNRTDAPYLPEGRMARDRTLGANQLRELYSVSLRLYGNTIIKPGQYIYVMPYPIGFGNPRYPGTISRTLGIGGYHLVTSVHSVIDRNGYETSLTALHEAMPLLHQDHRKDTPVATEFGTFMNATTAPTPTT